MALRPSAPATGRVPGRSFPTLPAAPLAALGAALAALLAAMTLVAPAAHADPVVPPNANQVVQALADANAKAEVANEKAMGAAEQLPIRQAEAARTKAASDAARGAADAARAQKEQAFVGVDALTRSSYQGGELDSLSALLASGSPQAYLDKVSLLDSISTEKKAALQRFLDASAAADAAQRTADAQATDAGRAADDAARTARDAAATKADADREVAAATAALDAASAADRASLRSGGITNYPTNVPGDGIAVAALRAALTQQGKPYVWGATGPDSFDCSGLVQWAYRQVGVGVPRVSQAQQQVGQAVDPASIQPGDLVFFGMPAYHVGIYVGGGRFLEAPQSGDVVKVAPLRAVTSIRRIAL